jgi:ParB/RepB/Spo0J family partition protein
MAQILAQKIELVAVEKLRLHPRNPRRGKVDQIAESIRVNGFTAPLIVQKSSMTVLAGNHRLKAAVKLGMPEVPCIVVDVDDDRALRILLADNKTSDDATNDQAALAVILHDISVTPDKLAGTVFTADELADLLLKFAPADPDAAEHALDTNAQSKICPTCGQPMK